MRFLEILVRLTREPGDDGRPEENVRNPFPERPDQLPKLGLGRSAVHPFEDRIGGRLDRKVQIMADLLLGRHHIETVPMPTTEIFTVVLFCLYVISFGSSQCIQPLCVRS